MMKVSLINGSQKHGESNSGIILEALSKLIKNDCEVKNYRLSMKLFPEETYNEIVSSDVIVFAFPLYFHSIPATMLKMLMELEKILREKRTKEIIVYTIINNGLFEGKQNHIAFDMIKHWCGHSGATFGGGIGQGAGEMIGAMKSMPLSFGPFNNLARALKSLANKISSKEPFDTVYLNPYFPRFLWSFLAVQVSWHPMARKNGLKKKDIAYVPISDIENHP